MPPPREITAEEADLRSVRGLCGGIRRPPRSPSSLRAAISAVYLMSESCPHRRAKLSAISPTQKTKQNGRDLQGGLVVPLFYATRGQSRPLHISNWTYGSDRIPKRGSACLLVPFIQIRVRRPLTAAHLNLSSGGFTSCFAPFGDCHVSNCH